MGPMSQGNDILIPKIVHRVWPGDDEMPEAFQRYGETWRQHHPDWEMKLWTPSNLPELKHPEAFHNAHSLTERSDVLRYEILRLIGGVYVDTDFECLRPLDPLLAGVDIFTARAPSGEVQNAIMGTVPGHPIFDAAVDGAARLAGSHDGAWHPGNKPIGPKFFADLLPDFPDVDVTIFESEKFYPYDWDEEPLPNEEYPDAYAIHRWTHSGRDPVNLSEDELRATVQRMRKQQIGAMRRTRAARAKAERTQSSVAKLEARLAVKQSRLETVEGSLWWRLRPRLPGRRG